jgi:hypothetical protein
MHPSTRILVPRHQFLVLAIALLGSACGQSAPPATAVISTQPPASQSPTLGLNQAPSKQELAAATAFRARFGLRADPEWVRTVAQIDSAKVAVQEFGFPLTPAEVADLASRHWDPDLLQNAKNYGSLFPASYAGAYINLKGSGVVIEFNDDIDRHRRALASLLPDGSVVDVRLVEWSLQDLERFAAEVEADSEWFASIGVTFKVGQRVNENWVNVWFTGRPEAEQLIEQHFGNPTWLQAEWDGPLTWQGPRADLNITVRDTSGRAVPGLWCDVIPVDPMVSDPGEDIIATDAGGTCVLENRPAVLYRVQLREPSRDGNSITTYELTPVLEFEVMLEPGGTTTVVTLPG